MDQARPPGRVQLSVVRRLALGGLLLLGLLHPLGARTAPPEGSPNTPPQVGKAGAQEKGPPLRGRRDQLPGAERQRRRVRGRPQGPPDPTTQLGLDHALRFLKGGRYQFAATSLSTSLDATPDDPQLLSLLGVARARLGQLPDAVGLFRLEHSGDVYEELGLEAHADALRDVGLGAEAAALRLSSLVVIERSEDELPLLLSAADDLLAAGDPWGAEDLVDRAIAGFPGSSAANAAMSKVLTAQGRQAEADGYLWLASRAPSGRSLRQLVDAAQLALAEVDFAEARVTVDAAMRMYPRSAAVNALRVELMMAEGNAEGVVRLMEGEQWVDTEFPELMAWEVRALRTTGRAEEAAEAQQRAEALYPAHPAVLTLSASAPGRSSTGAPPASEG